MTLVRGTAFDVTADVIVGQPNFNSIAQNTVVGYKLCMPGGVILDRAATPYPLLYVYDTGNNRVLVFEWKGKADWISHTPSPIRVLGQPDYTSSAPNGNGAWTTYPTKPAASASTLSLQLIGAMSLAENYSGCGMAIDSTGRLFVVDYYNHRVLRYPRGSSTADFVIGQPDFLQCQPNQTLAAPTASTLFFATAAYGNYYQAGITVDASDGIWIADNGNNRALHYVKDSATANIVIGQPDFVSNGFGSGTNQLSGPTDVYLSPSTGKLYVCDPYNNRVLSYTAAFTTGMSGTGLNFNGSTLTISASPNGLTKRLSGTYANYVEVQTSAAHGLLVGDSIDLGVNGLSAAGLYNGTWFVREVVDTTHFVISTAWTSDSGGGQCRRVVNNCVSLDVDPVTSGQMWSLDASGTTAHLLKESDSSTVTIKGNGDGNLMDGNTGKVAVTATGDIFVAVNFAANRNDVLYFDHADNATTYTALFGGGNVPNLLTDAGLYAITGVAVSDSADQLIVADEYRIRWWNGLSSLTTGQTADGHVTVGSMTAICVRGNDMYVAVFGDTVYRYALPLSGSPTPAQTLSTSLSLLGGGTFTGGGAQWGMYATANGELWCAQTDGSGNRVYRIRAVKTAPVVDAILGQPDSTTTTTGSTLSKMNSPGAVTMDAAGNLWVCDNALESQGNFRLLEFQASDIPSANGALIVNKAAIQEIDSTACWQPAFSSNGMMVAGFSGFGPSPAPDGVTAFPGIWEPPITGTPTRYIADYHSQAFGAVFDAVGNLYIADHNRSRVLIYYTPFTSVGGAALTRPVVDLVANLRRMNSPHSIIAQFPDIAINYGLQLMQPQTASFRISRADPNYSALPQPRVGAFFTIERSDGLLPFVGYVTDYDAPADDPEVSLVLTDYSWLLKNAVTQKSGAFSGNTGALVAATMREIDSRQTPPLPWRLDRILGGVKIDFEYRLQSGDAFVTQVAGDWEWGWHHDLTREEVTTWFLWDQQLGTDYSAEVVWDEGRHLSGVVYHQSAASYVSSSVAVGGTGDLAARPAGGVLSVGKPLAGVQTLPVPPNTWRSPALQGSRAVFEQQISNRDALLSTAKRLQKPLTDAQETIRFKIVESEVDMTKVDLGNIVAVRLATADLGSAIERTVRIVGINLDGNGTPEIISQVVT